MSSPSSPDFVPRKSALGAHLLASREPGGLSPGLRRLLLLADGRRTLFTLSQMLPDRDLVPDVAELMRRGLLEDARQPMPIPPGDRAEASDTNLPEGWESASDFMVSRARETLGVMAVNVIEALEQANDPEAARVAMSQWYRAIRNSRDGREHADVDRVKAAAILKGSRSGS